MFKIGDMVIFKPFNMVAVIMHISNNFYFLKFECGGTIWSIKHSIQPYIKCRKLGIGEISDLF